MTIYSFSYQSKNIEIFILKNKTIINHDRMFNLIKMYWFPKEMKNEKTVTAKLEYSLDDGKKYTEYTEIYVW